MCFLNSTEFFFSFTLQEIDRNYLGEMMLSTTHLIIEITLKIIYIAHTTFLKYTADALLYPAKKSPLRGGNKKRDGPGYRLGADGLPGTRTREGEEKPPLRVSSTDLGNSAFPSKSLGLTI